MMNKRKIFTVLAILIVLAFTLSLVSGCGGKDETKPQAPEPGDVSTTTALTGDAGNVLVVVADRDFNETEYDAVSLALSGSGYGMILANASGGDSVGDKGSVLPVDTTLDQVNTEHYEALVFVGGMGAEQYFEDAYALAIASEMNDEGKIVTAICIAPVILANAGLLEGKNATVSSSMKGELEARGAVLVAEPVVADGKIITGDGPDAAEEFAAEVVRALSA
jgi:protease I